MFNISVNGAKVAARKSAVDQCDTAIAKGKMTDTQKAAVLAKIDALSGPNIVGNISGADPQTETASFTGNFKNA
jgi:hypothetical protein